MDDQTYLPLGDAPLPTTGDELLARVTPHLQGSSWAAEAHDLLSRTEVVLQSPDIVSWHTDASGITVSEAALSAPDAPPAGPPLPPVAERHRGVLRDLHIQAHPMTVADVPVDLDLQLSGLPFDWVATTDGTVGVEPVEPEASNPISGTVRLRMAQEPLKALIRRIASEQATTAGADLHDLEVDLVSTGPRSVTVDVRATVRKGLLKAAIRGHGTATLDDALVLHLGDVALSAANPLVSALIAVARSRVEAAAARPIDLGSHLPPGVRVRHLAVAVDPDIEVALTLG